MTDLAPETFLARIITATREELAARQARTPLEELRARVADAPAPRDFAAALRPTPGGPARLIGEVKRASPSKGLLAKQFDPVALARAYEAGGAAAISVLTEPRYFLGSLEHLAAVRAAVSLPVLRKDFLLDPYQVYEARAAGADAALLILAMLDDARAADLLGLIRSLGMEALVEAHDAAEVERAVALGARVIGVNSRDLRTFEIDTTVTQHLRPLVPANRVFVAESGVRNRLGAAKARVWGADAILVGEALMGAADPEVKTRKLSTAPGGATAALFAGTGRPFVKICGLAEPEQARVAAEAGADAIGLIFAPMAPAHRLLTPERAARIVAALPPPGGPRPVPIGVFVNTPLERIAAIAEQVGLAAIQLSGDEPAKRCARLAKLTGLPVIKAVRAHDARYTSLIEEFVLAGVTILLDGAAPDNYGGSGMMGDWDQAWLVASNWPVILAGGLTPENVADAIEVAEPRGVDVSSGVESIGPDGPAKDLDKIRAFIAAARGASTHP
jgi:indole-3-glycerol phosphate synthase/phosphoribosylanthranilate isomerase